MVQLLGQNATGDWLTHVFGLHFYLAPDFYWWQPFTYMFLHGSWSHVLLNMLSLWMFGRIIEANMGQGRFLVYYLVCGVGAALCQEFWQTAQYYYEGLFAYDVVNAGGILMPMEQYLNSWNTIGASGATYGVLLAFGMTYPEERIMMLFPPIPMKAKYFVMVYAAIELFSAFGSNGNIAHFAHLGGMLFGWLLIRQWRRQAQRASQGRFWQYPHQTTRPQSHSTYFAQLRHVFLQMGTQLERWVRCLLGESSSSAQDKKKQSFQNADQAYNAYKRKEQARVDAILDKVRRSGYASLSEEEKQILFRNSRK